MDRVQLLNEGQWGGLVMAYQRALGDQRPADAPGDRCGNGGVTQVQACPLQGRLGRGHLGFGLLRGGAGVVMVLAADRVDADQLAVALILQAGLEVIGLGLGQAGPGAVVIGLERRRVDAEQDIALFHVAAFAKHLLQHHAGHPCADFGNARGENATIELGADGQGLHLDGFHGDLDLRRLLLGRGR
ncbi:hypothetical protein D3C85_738840 [compost metagenome]